MLSSTEASTVQVEVETEWDELQAAVGGLQSRGEMRLHRLRQPSWAALQEAFIAGSYHVFHFVGHGEPGRLLIEDEDGSAMITFCQKVKKVEQIRL